MNRIIALFAIVIISVSSCTKKKVCYKCRTIDTGTGSIGAEYDYYTDGDIQTYMNSRVDYYTGFDKRTHKRYTSCH